MGRVAPLRGHNQPHLLAQPLDSNSPAAVALWLRNHSDEKPQRGLDIEPAIYAMPTFQFLDWSRVTM